MSIRDVVGLKQVMGEVCNCQEVWRCGKGAAWFSEPTLRPAFELAL